MLYEIGIRYTGDKEHDAQIKIPNIPIAVDRRKFWFGGRSISHWNEEITTPWVKVPVLQKGTTKIYVDDSANRNLSNIDETMIFGDDFEGATTIFDLTSNAAISTEQYKSPTHSLHITPSTTETDGANYAITWPSTGYVEINADFYITGQSAHLITFKDLSGNWVGPHISVHWDADSNPDEIEYHDATQWNYTNHYITENTWQHFALIINISNSTYNLFFNEEKIIDGAFFISNLTTTDYLHFLVVDGTTKDSDIYVDNVFERKYLSTDPVITYIKPYHKWWLFQSLGGITKVFYASVLEKVTHSTQEKASTDEQLTHEKSNIINVEEDVTQTRSLVGSNVENITQNATVKVSANEQITQTFNLVVNSLENIVNEFSFISSSVEQVSNTKDGKISSLETITQDKQVVINAEERIINEYDFVANSLESIKNDITSKAGAIEENTQLKETIINTVEQMMNVFEFYASSLESIRNQAKTLISTQESMSNQTSTTVSTIEQMMNIYEFLGGTVEEISNNVQSLASVEERIANENIALVSVLEEINQIVVGARPIFAKTITEIKKLKSKIEEVL